MLKSDAGIGNLVAEDPLAVLDDVEKERIKFNTELIKLLTLLFITTGGGGLAIAVEGIEPGTKLTLVVAGMFFSLTCGVLAIFVFWSTKKKLKRKQ